MFPKKTKVNQWRNTSTVTNWFKNPADKQKWKFIKFDITELYLSLSEDLLNKLFTTIAENVISAIKLACKSVKMEHGLREMTMSYLT